MLTEATDTTRRISLHTLGCKLNQAETATIGRQFVREGFRIVPFGDPADVVVLNTCSVTEKADRECRQLVRRIRRSSPDAFVAVVGCYAQLRPEEIAALPGVDLIAGTTEKFDLVRHALHGRTVHRPRILRTNLSQAAAIVSHSQGADRTRAFLKVQDGCDYTCSFCTIPLARGASRSVDEETVMREAIGLVKHGYREIVLTGVNTGDYGRKEGRSLVGLLRRLLTIGDLNRIRISSVEPNLMSDELLDVWMEHDRICKHWHMPLQSGTDSVLRRMRRRYTTAWYKERVERIHERFPDAAIGADVIVGFPGETEGEFAETLRFLKDLPVTYLHVFSYSQRPWTEADASEEQVDPAVRALRSRILRDVSDRKRRAFHERMIGRTLSVLVEGPDETGAMTGLSEEYVRVRIPEATVQTNDLVDVCVTAADGDGCTAAFPEGRHLEQEVRHAVA